MLRKQIKDKFNSTINHIKSHPATYGYVAGAAVGIASTAFAYYIITKDAKLVDLAASLKHIQDQGLTGLKFELDDETMLLFPASITNLNLD